MDSLIGRRLGNYRIDSLIGQGGMGAVYHGTHVTLDRPVAIKTLLPELSANSEFSTRFLREAQVASKVRHPRLVQVYDFGSEDGITYLVMDFLEGTPLDRLIGALTTSRSIALLGQIGEAVDYIHSQDIAHRDLKPANIIVDVRDRITIVDFGLARLVGSANLTSTGMFPGTPAYMAPERFTNGDPQGKTSDQYAVGVIAYEMLTGDRPFSGSDITQIMYQIMSANPVPPSAIRPDLAPYDAAVLRQLAKDPAQRFPSVTAFVSQLTSGTHQPSAAATILSPGQSFGPPATILKPSDPAPGFATSAPGMAPPSPVAPGIGMPSPVAPPKRRSNTGCILGIIAAIGLVACVGVLAFAGIIGGLAAFGSASGPVDAADKYMTAIKNSDWQSAYNLCGTDLQQEIGSVSAMQDFIVSNRVQPTSWNFTTRNVDGDYAAFAGTVTFTGNRKGGVALDLENDGTKWKITSIDLKED